MAPFDSFSSGFSLCYDREQENVSAPNPCFSTWTFSTARQLPSAGNIILILHLNLIAGLLKSLTVLLTYQCHVTWCVHKSLAHKQRGLFNQHPDIFFEFTTANIENDDDGDNDDGDNDASFQEISNAKKQQENDESKAE